MKKKAKLTLLERVIRNADVLYDGHLTIFKFTTGWKVVYGTPEISADCRDFLRQLPGHDTLDDALGDAGAI
jgi:hypothetical protein